MRRLSIAADGARVPLPPERPFDLGTIPNAATPVSIVSSAEMVLPPARPVVARAIFRLRGDPPGGGFSTALARSELQSAGFVTLKPRL